MTLSPYYPQANSEAESEVHIAKKILMPYRATAHTATGVSQSLLANKEIKFLPFYLKWNPT